MKQIYGIIYRASLNYDGRCYVGQTTFSLNERKQEHFKNFKRLSDTRHFYCALRQYGFENFEWYELEKCFNKEELDLAERKWIKYFDSIENGFNLKEGGSYGKHYEETKKKISDGRLGENNPAYGKPSWNSGKKLSEEHCKNLSKSHLGQNPWNKGVNTGQKNASKLTLKEVEEIRKQYNIGIKQSLLAKKYKVHRNTIRKIIIRETWND